MDAPVCNLFVQRMRMRMSALEIATQRRPLQEWIQVGGDLCKWHDTHPNSCWNCVTQIVIRRLIMFVQSKEESKNGSQLDSRYQTKTLHVLQFPLTNISCTSSERLLALGDRACTFFSTVPRPRLYHVNTRTFIDCTDICTRTYLYPIDIHVQ